MAAQQATGAVPAATRLPTVQLCFDRRNPRLKHLVDAHAGDPVG